MKPRPYQQQAIDSAKEFFDGGGRSSLIVCPTGTGKTVIFAHLADHFVGKGRVMVLAHREELLDQAKEKLNRIVGYDVSVERAENWSNEGMFKSRVVVSSVQTQNAGTKKRNGGRMMRFNPNEFSLLIIDEAHHAVARTYRTCIAHYGSNHDLKILGVTATPDRHDESALGKVFDHVAYEYGVVDAIDDGWLVPIKQQFVQCEDLDFSGCRTTAGDLNGADLARVMEYERNLHEVVGPTIDIADGRKTLLFASSVAHAERMTEILNRHQADCARIVTGKTPGEERREMLRAYRENRFQFLCNVGVATEGFDIPDIAVVAMARPTKSRALYAQMLGRGTRPVAPVDKFEQAEERQTAIANSEKPTLLVLDFVGNSGRHKLISTGDILGGDYSDAVVARAEESAKKATGEVDIRDELDRAAREIQNELDEERRKAIRSKARYRSESVSPFDTLNISTRRIPAWHKGREITEKQKAFLEKCGISIGPEMGFAHASQLIEGLMARRKHGMATYRQVKLLERYGYDTAAAFSFEEASKKITAIKANGWKRMAV